MKTTLGAYRKLSTIFCRCLALPNSKTQMTNKSQAPVNKFQTWVTHGSLFGFLKLGFIWDFVAWDLGFPFRL